tara:strand:+ start:1203 stop:1397 length:195 start_codon:yes stop_codon:yes gene_type:complete
MKDKVFESKLKDMLEYYEMAEDERRLELRIYKVRWVWYHTILAIGLGFVVYLLWEINNKLGGLI